jgi:homocysteine S-methyltransferase
MKINKYLLFDGAMGTYYGSKQRPYTGVQANIMDYNTIVSIHKEYIAAGAQAITTNTFGNSEVESVRAACAAAQDAAKGTKTYIFGSIGPLADSDREKYISVLDQMRHSGITNYIFETFPSRIR